MTKVRFELKANHAFFRHALPEGKEVRLDADGSSSFETADATLIAELDAADGVKRAEKQPSSKSGERQ